MGWRGAVRAVRVSSCRPGAGARRLLDSQPHTYWQSSSGTGQVTLTFEQFYINIKLALLRYKVLLTLALLVNIVLTLLIYYGIEANIQNYFME